MLNHEVAKTQRFQIKTFTCHTCPGGQCQGFERSDAKRLDFR